MARHAQRPFAAGADILGPAGTLRSRIRYLTPAAVSCPDGASGSDAWTQRPVARSRRQSVYLPGTGTPWLHGISCWIYVGIASGWPVMLLRCGHRSAGRSSLLAGVSRRSTLGPVSPASFPATNGLKPPACVRRRAARARWSTAEDRRIPAQAGFDQGHSAETTVRLTAGLTGGR